MTTEFEVEATKIEAAQGYFDYFGASDDPEQHVKRTYRRVSRVVYPDYHQGQATHARASDVFSTLTKLYDEACEMAKRGKYGQPSVLITWKTRKGEHVVTDSFGTDSLCALYRGSTQLHDGGASRTTLCKVASDPSDNDLLQAEVAALRKLRGPDMDADLHVFFPELVDKFAHREDRARPRQVNVLAMLDGFYDLTQIGKAFPAGIEAVHMAWIWRRILWSLGHAHRQKVLHGALLPEHVLVLPEQHGVVLANWYYASLGDDNGFTPIKAIVGPRKVWYPQEVLTKQTPSPATDIMMAARCMIELLGGDPLTGIFPTGNRTPRAFQAFFRSCLAASPHGRPQGAHGLLGEFDQLLERLGDPYYPRRFRVFTMPQAAGAK